jgi:hypothetical protein
MMTAEEEGGRVLVLAPVGRDGPAIADLLRRAGLPGEVCNSLADLTEAVDRGAAAVFLAEEALFGKDLAGLSGWVGRQPPWSDLPFIVLTSHQDQRAIIVWRQQLITALRNASFGAARAGNHPDQHGAGCRPGPAAPV